MRMQNKNVICILATIISVFVVIILGRYYLSGQAFFVIALVLLAAIAVIPYIFLRCPYYGKVARRTKHGAYVPWVGESCRSCGNPF